MPGEIFNPNPVIFTKAKGAGRQADLLANSLWINENTTSDDEADDVEEIDQDEIYGASNQSLSTQDYAE